MTRTIVDISILQSVPPSNLNRDDTGSPKTATYGGSRRARVSSQAWKRATRLAFNSILDTQDLGTRTKRVVELIAGRIVAIDPKVDSASAQELAESALRAAGIKLSAPRKASAENPLPNESGYLLFFSSRQLDHVAALCIEANNTDDPTAALKGANVKKALDSDHSIDLALFGRMVAEATDLNVDAACQVAHAISVHPVATEFDYFTAIDDRKAAADSEDAGAGMIGTVEFNASTLFRYATVDVDALQRNLGDADAARRAVEAFVRAFTTSMPSGKQNTFANRTLPDAVIIAVRDSQSVNPVGAFEDAIVDGHRVKQAAERLVAHISDVDDTFGTTPTHTWTIRVGAATDALDGLKDAKRSSLDDAVKALGQTVFARLTATS